MEFFKCREKHTKKFFFAPIWTFKVSIDSSGQEESNKLIPIAVALPVQKLQPFKVEIFRFC